MGRRAAVVGAVDGARARPPVHALRDRRRQRPHRPRRAAPGLRGAGRGARRARSTSAASTSAPTTCAAFDWDPFAYEAGLGEALAWLGARCERTLTATIPLDLGRPRAGAKVADANAIIERRARESGTLVVDLSRFRGRDVLMADHVHPTAFGQIAIAERALAVLAADGLPPRKHPREMISYETTRWGRLRGDATYAYRHAKVSARGGVEPAQAAERSSAASSATWRRRLKRRRAPMSSGRIAPRSWRCAPRRRRALEEAVALEQGRAGEVGLGDEAAGRLERAVVLAAAARGGQGGRPDAERLATRRGRPNQPGAGPSYRPRATAAASSPAAPPTSLGLAAGTVVETDPRAVILLLAPALAVFLAYRASPRRAPPDRRTSSSSTRRAGRSRRAAGTASPASPGCSRWRSSTSAARSPRSACSRPRARARLADHRRRRRAASRSCSRSTRPSWRELSELDGASTPAARLVTPEAVGGALAGHLRRLGVQQRDARPAAGRRAARSAPMMIANRSGLGGAFDRSEIGRCSTRSRARPAPRSARTA